MADEHTRYPARDWEEWQYNVLTSYLLLPRELVLQHFKNAGLPQGIKWLDRVYAPKDYHRFSEAAHRLGVSKTTLSIRLSRLVEVTFKKYTRRVNHIVYLFDKWTIRSRIRNDDTSVLQMLDRYNVAQITDFLNTAIESKAANLTTALLTYKQEHVTVKTDSGWTHMGQ